MCAGNVASRQGSCKGDSGSPLMVFNTTESRYVQVGIVGWGIGCGSKVPGVYANVSKALCFIEAATRFVSKATLDPVFDRNIIRINGKLIK